MPDSFDYDWLKRLLAHPERWSPEDLSAVRLMIANQKRALEDLHPKDIEGRRAARNLIEELEAALQEHTHLRR